MNAYNVLSGREDLQHIGGAEVQQVRIALWLVRRGYPVSFVTLDHGQPDGIDLDGIRVLKAYAAKDGVRGLRFFHPRWSGLWAAMSRANADVYYQRTAESETGQVALWCRLHHRKFIFAAASHSDCDPQSYPLESWIDRALYRIGVRLADTITAQTVAQQDLFRQRMGLSSVHIRNCGWGLPGGSSCEQTPTADPRAMRVLWVGRISEKKRFEWLLDVAERCPDTVFEVVGAPNGTSAYSSSLTTRAARIPNVRMHGWVPHTETPKYYQRCRILCCTSPNEGFPNAFLEAWALGMPVVSTFDPDGVIATNGLGWVAQDVEGIVACLRRIIESPQIWDEASKAAQEYYLTNHTPEVCVPVLERLLLRVAGCETDPV